MVIARKKSFVEIVIKVSQLRATQTTAETKNPDFMGHYVICFLPKPGHGTLLQFQMKGKHCRHKRTVPSNWN